MMRSCELELKTPTRIHQENKAKKGISLSLTKKGQNQSETQFKYIKLYNKIR